jgi:hypothetical protein
VYTGVFAAVQDFDSEREAIVDATVAALQRAREFVSGLYSEYDPTNDVFHLRYDVSSGVSVDTLGLNIAALVRLRDLELRGQHFERVPQEKKFTNRFIANIILTWLRAAGLTPDNVRDLVSDDVILNKSGIDKRQRNLSEWLNFDWARIAAEPVRTRFGMCRVALILLCRHFCLFLRRS